MIRSCLPIACLLTLFVVSDANAQRRIPNYTRGNTLSPYINMFRGNTGGINNYFSLVRPMQAQSRFNQMQMTQDRRLQQQLIMNQSNFPFGPYAVGQQGIGAQSMLHPGSQGAGRPTSAASYFDYSHFYGVPITGPSLRNGARTR